MFDGTGTFTIGGTEHSVERGDMIVVPSWVPFSIAADDGLDLFRFGDHPIVEKLALHRVQEDDQ